MIIDAHTHGFHGKYLDQLVSAGGKWAKQNIETLLALTRNKPQFLDIDLRVGMLNRNNIDLQVVTPAHHLDSNSLPGDVSAQLIMARAINDNMARLMEDSKGRLLAGGNIPLAGFGKGSEQEMERAIKTLGLKTISIPTNLRGKPPDLPEFEPFWAAAADMNVPVYIHPNDPVRHGGRSYEAEYDLLHNFGWPFETTLILSRLVFSGIMERYPTIKVVSHHLGGGMIPFFWGRINETYASENQQKTLGSTLPKPLFNYFSRFYYDTAVGGSAPAIKCAYDVFGADHLIFATDAPWGTGTGESRLSDYPKVIKSLGLSETDENKILGANAKILLNLV